MCSQDKCSQDKCSQDNWSPDKCSQHYLIKQSTAAGEAASPGRCHPRSGLTIVPFSNRNPLQNHTAWEVKKRCDFEKKFKKNLWKPCGRLTEILRQLRLADLKLTKSEVHESGRTYEELKKIPRKFSKSGPWYPEKESCIVGVLCRWDCCSYMCYCYMYRVERLTEQHLLTLCFKAPQWWIFYSNRPGPTALKDYADTSWLPPATQLLSTTLVLSSSPHLWSSLLSELRKILGKNSRRFSKVESWTFRSSGSWCPGLPDFFWKSWRQILPKSSPIFVSHMYPSGHQCIIEVVVFLCVLYLYGWPTTDFPLLRVLID